MTKLHVTRDESELGRGLRRMALATVSAAAVVFAASGASAKELSYAVGYAPGTLVGNAVDVYAERVAEASGGALTVKVYNLSLLSLMETVPGLRDGLADIGYALVPAYAAEFPYANLATELNMAVNLGDPNGREHIAYAGAVSDFIFNDCPKCVDQFSAQNQVYMGAGTSSLYVNMCNKPVSTLDEMKGKRIRTGSASFVRFVENFGGVAVQIAANEVFEGLSQGIIDCAMLAGPELKNLNLTEVVSDITSNMPGGVYAAGIANMNRDTWMGLTAEERTWVLRGTAAAAASMSWAYRDAQTKTLDDAKAAGTAIHEAPADFIEGVQEFVRGDQGTIISLYKTQYGVPEAEELAATFFERLDKWNGLVASVESVGELEDLFWNELYSKVDVANYGM